MLVTDIDVMLAEGIPFDTIEDRINAAPIPTEVKSLLWLYAWTWQSRDGQRQVVADMIATLRQ